MGCLDWLCGGSSPTGKEDSRKDEQKAPQTQILTSESIGLKPEKPAQSFPPLITPINEVPPYVNVIKPLIPEDTLQGLVFNVRKKNPKLIDRREEVDRLQGLIDQRKELGKSMTVIDCEETKFGGRGSGKSELLRQYIDRYGQQYKYIIWVDSETKPEFTNCFFHLAQSLDKYVYDENDMEKYKMGPVLAKELFRTLCKQPSLLIFDNVSSETIIMKMEKTFTSTYLPTCMDNRLKPVILVVSRISPSTSEKLPDGVDVGKTPLSEPAIFLKSIDQKSLVQFLLQQLELPDSPENQTLALQVVEMCWNSPLFLRLVVQLVQNLCKDALENPLQEFLDFIEERKRIILPLRSYDAQSHPFLHVMLMIIIREIIMQPKFGQVCRFSLAFLSYFLSTKIPKKLFQLFFPLESPKVVEAGLEFLQKYGIVQDYDEEGDFLETHTIIQEALREIMKTNNSMEQMLLRLIQGLLCLLENGISRQDKIYLPFLACCIEVEKHVQNDYSNPIVLDFVDKLAHKTQKVHFYQSMMISQRIADYYEKIHGVDHRNVVMSKHDVALILFHERKYADAHKLFQYVWETAEKVLGRSSRPSLYSGLQLANTLVRLGKYEEAEHLYVNSLDARKYSQATWKGIPNETGVLLTKYLLASLYEETNRSEKSLEIIGEILPRVSETSGPHHVYTIEVRILKAAALNSLERREDALKEVEEILAICKDDYGDIHPATVKALGLQANVLCSQGNHEESLKIFYRIVNIQLKHFVMDPETAMQTKTNMGKALLSLEKTDQALQVFGQASDFGRALLEENNSMVVANERDIANVLRLQGRLQEALEMYVRVYERQKETLGEDHLDTVSTKETVELVLRRHSRVLPN